MADNATHVGLSADEWGLGPPWVVETFNVAHGMFAGEEERVAFMCTAIEPTLCHSIASHCPGKQRRGYTHGCIQLLRTDQ